MNHLEKAIYEMIEKHYERKYVGKIKVTRLENGYNMVMDFCNPDAPLLQIAADIEDETEFLKFIEQELISRQLQRGQWYKGIIKSLNGEERGTYCKNRPSNCRTS